MAALELPNGDRRLFFQDQSGFIRQAFYSSSSREWRADINYIVASDAKNHTPIAVVNPSTISVNETNNTNGFPFFGSVSRVEAFPNIIY